MLKLPLNTPVKFVTTPEVGVPNNGVTKVGEVANTAFPVPISSLITPANSAEVVAANCERGSVVRASPPPAASSKAGAISTPAEVNTCPSVPSASSVTSPAVLE